MNSSTGLLFSVRDLSRNPWSLQLHCTLCRALNAFPHHRNHHHASRPHNHNHNNNNNIGVAPRAYYSNFAPRGGSRPVLYRYGNKTNPGSAAARTGERQSVREFRTAACFASIPSQTESQTLSRREVNSIIREHERVVVLDDEKGVRCETNNLASNRPIEDQLFITRSTLLKQDVLFGVLDGHSGPMFGKVVRQRLPYYLHSALCAKHLGDVVNSSWSPVQIVDNLLGSPLPSDAPWVAALNSYIGGLTKTANDSLSYAAKFRQFILGKKEDGSAESVGVVGSYDDVRETIKTTFKRLDDDITNEIKTKAANNDLNAETKALASSGCCALIAYLMEDELFVANVGDCRAVLGSRDHDGSWVSRPLTVDHSSAANSGEVQRVIREHPAEENRTCIKYGRLLGVLQPLRAFGDIQLKQSREELSKIFSFVPNYKPFKELHTPPYLTAEPEVFHYKLDASDKFIVLATDGLWDILSNEDVVAAVAAYIEGQKVQMLRDKAHLFGISNRADAFTDMEEENVASFLIRFALEGYDEDNLRGQLSLPYPEVRWYRDDITVIVLFLNDNASVGDEEST